ncbi:MAG: DUF4157 domain-containing protein [Acidimicrobiales bacterium]
MGALRKDKAEDGQDKRPARKRSAAPDIKPSMDSVQGFLQLQRTIGNRAVCRLATGGVLQPKLQVGPAGDPYEREADRVADEVMRNLSPTVQTDDLESPVRRSLVETAVGLEGGPLGADTEAEVQRHRGGGARLPGPLQQSMEHSFGADFGGVRVHTGPAADELSRSMQASAFTVGSDIFLARGQYRPQTTSGQRLLAHELTHTVQQGAVGRTVTTAAPNTVQRLAVDSDTLADWDNLASGKASGGVSGVIFAKGADGSEVVVKGMQEPPQRAMLAQDLMEDVGVTTTRTRPVAASSALGQKILQELGALGGRQTDAHGVAIATKVGNWQNYQTLLLMEPANVKSFYDLATKGPELPPPVANFRGGARAMYAQDIAQHVTFWTNLLSSQQMWTSFGKIFYIDQFLGNEDRFETMKIQNVFVDPTTLDAVALDNDTIAADYIKKVTEVDAISNKNNPKTNISTMTTDEYIRAIIQGGYIYNNDALQARAMGSLDEISGRSGELGAKINLKVTTFLATLQGGVANGNSVNDKAATQVLTSVLANTNNALTAAQRNMKVGAVRAREHLQEMCRTKTKANSLKGMFERQLDRYKPGYNTKVDTLYSWLALEVRYMYLAYRATGMDHNTTVAKLQSDYKSTVNKAKRTARTDQSPDYVPELTKIK